MKKLTVTGAVLLLCLTMCSCNNIFEKGASEENVNQKLIEKILLSEGEHIDNTVDAYTAVCRTDIRPETPAGALSGGGRGWNLGPEGVVFYKRHLMKDKTSWDEIIVSTTDGEQKSHQVHWTKTEGRDQVMGVGGTAAGDQYLILTLGLGENSSSRYELTVADRNLEPVKSIPLSFLSTYEYFGTEYCVMDSQGDVHFINNNHYYVVDEGGELLLDKLLEVPVYDMFLSDGQVMLQTLSIEGEAQYFELYTINKADGSLHSVLKMKSNQVQKICPLDMGQYLVADGESIYTCDAEGENRQILYLFRNHGIMPQRICGLQVIKQAERISILYEENEVMRYTVLEPVTDKREIETIKLAVSPSKVQDYKAAVVEFNKRYPMYCIELVDYYEDTLLLTELSAGQGPVLVDTSLTGFENCEKLWQPLDELFAQFSLEEELLPEVMQAGKIDGRLYGVVSEFYLRTVVVDDPSLKDWNYATFLDTIEANSQLQFLMNNDGNDNNPFSWLYPFFLGDERESYLFEDKQVKTERIQKVLELAEKYIVENPETAPYHGFEDGRIFCNLVTIARPEQMALYRGVYGDAVNYIGFPGREKACHYIHTNQPLTIRKSASGEEKAIAFVFMNMLLSYEAQSDCIHNESRKFSVRKDVLQKQFQSVKADDHAFAFGFGDVKIGNKLNNALDEQVFSELLANARPRKYLSDGIGNIVREELEQYFAPGSNREMILQRLIERATLFFQEEEKD